MSKNIRVAFSGSGFRFPAHVGALSAIDDSGYTPIEFAGTSGGSIIAALAASGMSVKDMKNLALTNDWSSMLTMSLMSLLTLKGYCDGSYLLDWMVEHTQSKTFSNVGTDLVVMSSDITNARPFRWSRDSTPNQMIALATRASASIPFVYTPVLHNGIYSVDGGVENNLPVMQLKQDDVLRIGIDLINKETTLTDLKPLSLGGRMLNMMLNAAESTQAMFGQYSGAKISYVESGYANSLDRNMSIQTRTRLFNDGYQATLDLINK